MYVTFTHESKRDGIEICIVIHPKTVLVNTYAYLKQCTSCFLMSHGLKMFQMSFVPVKNMITLYCWHSNVNKSFENKIGSERNMNSLKIIYFKERPSMASQYTEVAFVKTILFSYMHFPYEKISLAFNLHETFHNYWNIQQKNNIHGKK